MRALIPLLLALPHAPCAAPLAIVNVVVSQIEDGPAAPSGHAFVPGETVHFRFLVENFGVTSERRVRLNYSIDATDPKGVKLMETVNSAVDTEISPQDKDWKPKVHRELFIPVEAPSGTYKISVQVKDEAGGGSAGKEIGFAVRGHNVQPSDTLVIRNFRFYRSEDDRQPISPAAYRPGDAVWARFDMVGYKFSPGNAVHVDYGISVLAPGGRVLFSQPEAAVEKSASFYPKWYVPGTMNLALQPAIRPGEYAIVISVHDRIGNQSYEQKETFSVE